MSFKVVALAPAGQVWTGADRAWTAGPNRQTILTVLDAPNLIRQTERREGTRREILDAAWTVARELGIAQVTLRDVATRVGMRAPSLYTHFDSKHAIYDAMFGEAWAQCLAEMKALDEHRPRTARAALRRYALAFFDFSVADLARFQLMNQRTIPGFTPTQASYAPAVATIDELKERFAGWGIHRQQDVDLYVALVGGLVDAQLANDPGGDRWRRLVHRATDMYADSLGL